MESNDQRRVSRRRNRLPVSCGHCRFRKLKCNRAKPCESCVKAGDAATCSYMSNQSEVPSGAHYSSSNGHTNDALIARIDRLESLLSAVMSNQSQQPGAELLQDSMMPSGSLIHFPETETINEAPEVQNEPEINTLVKSFGVMKVDPGQTVYLGGAHWVSIMSEIQEFRSYLAANHRELEHEALESKASAKASENSSLLRGTSTPKALEELISYVPPRTIADKLIIRYFKCYSASFPIIHETTFRKQYSEHWRDPKKTTTIWLALLFGMFRHAEMSYAETEDESFPGNQEFSGEYRNQAIECLVAADFANPRTHTIEALLLYVQAEWMESHDASIELSAVIGMIVRLAMRMGIHRDSTPHPRITSFQGEMRRRVWAAIRIMDILYSFQISLPAITHSHECDCELPRNIYDHEFGEDIAVLPPSREWTNITEASYTILKIRLLLVLRRVLTLAESNNSITDDDVMEHEQALQGVRNMIPPHFQISFPGEMADESIGLKKTRIHLDRIYQTAQCILYWQFLLQARRDAAFSQYRRRCIDAALTLLSHQASLYLDCGSTYPQSVRKRHLSTLTTHDFFLACMAVALDLYYGFEFESFSPSSNDISLWGYDRRNEMMTALDTAIEFWRVSKKESEEAAKAHGMFSFVLAKVKKSQWNIELGAGSNQTISGDSAVPFEGGGLGMQEHEWPSDFNWGLWNSWGGDGAGFESLSQGHLFDLDSSARQQPKES